MSDNFTDTTKYASSLNLGSNSASKQPQAMNPTPNFPPLASKPTKKRNIASIGSIPVNNNSNNNINNNTTSSNNLNNSTASENKPPRKRQTVVKKDDKHVERPITSTNLSNNANTESGVKFQSPAIPSPAPAAPQHHQQSTTHQAGHRPVTSCTHCRQHKIKCNASERFPAPCQRCEKMGLNCEIDPQFRPRKGSQIQSLRNDVDELKLKIEYLQRNESLIAQALANHQASSFIKKEQQSHHLPQISSPLNMGITSPQNSIPSSSSSAVAAAVAGTNGLKREPHFLLDNRATSGHNSPSSIPQLLNDSTPTNGEQQQMPPYLELSISSNNNSKPGSPSSLVNNKNESATPLSNRSNSPAANSVNNTTATTTTTATNNSTTATTATAAPITATTATTKSPNNEILEFILGDVHLSLEKANELHDIFIRDYLPNFPIMSSTSATELYSQSQLLFWVVCLTACLSDPEPTLYNQLASLIKQLAIETCWIRTPRSTHISQALLILCIWPLPNQKVLDDCSYRFVGLAKSLGYQLGLHRGKFISEFSRTQVSLPDAEKWRTRTWLGIFFTEQFWASNLGLPPSLQTDYLIENARINENLPKNFRSLISLSIFQGKLCNVMGSSVISPDGLMEARNRAGSLAILERELERLVFKLKIEDDVLVEVYYLYVKLTICCFAFLPETPTEDQTKYVTQAYLTATRIITLVSKLLETKNLIELPIYIRQGVTYSAFILFKLHLTPLLLERYIDSARQSIVTVHRLFRNQLSAWKNVENDISRTAQVLEKLNFVLFTHPELFTQGDGIITRMRSHLTGSLFYDLVWCIHEARRRNLEAQKNGNYKVVNMNSNTSTAADSKRPIPLPFYNQINKDDFQTITTTTPGGTTITTLVPTKNAMTTATANATAAGLSKPVEINGIPLSMLDSTGSIEAGAPAVSATSSSNVNMTENNSASAGNGGSTSTTTNSNSHTKSNGSPIVNVPIPRPITSASANVRNNILNPSLPDSNMRQMQPNIPFNNFEIMNENEFSTTSFDHLANNENITQSDFDSFFQQQNAGWVEGNDDFLGWFDINMAPEF